MGMHILLKSKWAKSGQNWDVKLEVKDNQKILERVRELAEMKNMLLKGRCFERSYKKKDLHILSNASLESMRILAYLRAENEVGVELSFVIGKCRIAPMNQQTTPKLELQALFTR